MTPEGKEKMKELSLKIAEKHVIAAIDVIYEVAQVYVDDTTNPLDNGILEALKLLKGLATSAAENIHDAKEESE